MINLFPKLQDNQYNRQSWGGILFLITITSIIILIWTEINNALKGTIQLQVDSIRDSTIRVNVDIITQVPCQALTLNLQDMMGSYLQDVQHTITKTRIIDQKLEFININYNQNFTSCYGAQILVDQKCYTCQDVMMAYAQRRWRSPNAKSIIQCVGQPTVKFDDSQQILFKIEEEKKIQDLQEAKQHLLNVSVTELYKQSIELDEEDDDDVTEQIMSQEQREKFRKALGQLSELGYNPMQWDDQRLKQEKGKQIDQLIGMLNISLDHIGGTLASQLRFADRERVFPFRNLTNETHLLTEIYRQKCETQLDIYMNATYDEGNTEEVFKLSMPKNVCSIPFYYSTNDGTMNITVQDHQINWTINTTIMMNQIQFFIEKLLVINEEYNYNYQPNSMLDRAYSQFRISVYVHIKQMKLQNQINNKNDTRRMLFSEPFSVEQPQAQYIEAADIEENINESCRFFGYFNIKKVPGVFAVLSNKQAMEFINHTFQGNHSIKLSFGETTQNEQITYSDFSSKYYLKLVTTNVIDIWGQVTTHYTFTQQRSLYNATVAPFIEVQYEFDPISMTMQSTSITNYVVIIFAVIGGVFAVSKYIAGILNMLI